ncbi:unnamed protein product [Enterobius vermicularis]|uniref:Uncharacterized protein n=1 Tax=Enterobius vermicularis TaxID=51028 RepID=A0A0N4VHT2_ENTVE|nr:unnamed protein product [Enterobius vermicularis]
MFDAVKEKEANYDGLRRQENMLLNQWYSRSTANIDAVMNSTSEGKPLYENHLSIATIAIILLIIGATATWICRKRMHDKRMQTLRRADITGDDEDDLLISSVYAT